MRVLILSSGNPRGTLAAARSLRHFGWSVSVGTADTGGLAAWSRAVRSVHPVPKVEAGLDAFLAAAAEAVEATGSEVVLPGSDAELLALSFRRDAIPAVVPLAPHADVRRAVDKLELHRSAVRAGLPSPATLPATGDAFERVVYPTIVKSRFHWLPEHARDAPSRLNASLAPDPATARAAAETIRRAGGEPLLQAVLTGGPVNVHVLADRDGTVRSMLQQDSPQLFYPPGAGTRVRSVSVPVDPPLAAAIPPLVRDLGWFGYAGLSFLRDADGVAHYVDFNGRLGSNLEASQGAGAPYVAAWMAMATDRPPPPLGPLVIGKRFHYLEGDVRRALHERRGGLARDLAGVAAWAPRAHHTVAKWDEPLVSLRFVARQLRESALYRRLRDPR